MHDKNGDLKITGYNKLVTKGTNKRDEIRDLYLAAVLQNDSMGGTVKEKERLLAYQKQVEEIRQFVQHTTSNNKESCVNTQDQPTQIPLRRNEPGVVDKKKYKPVAKKVRPVLGTLPGEFRIERTIRGDPLEGMPEMNPKPRDFEPTGRYTAERKEIIDKAHPGDFLWEEERKLVHNIMMDYNHAFAWEDSERGRFREDFFPPLKIPVVEHVPWVLRNIPIPPGIYDEVCKIIKKKINAGVYEPSNSSYRSQWFCVLKKDGKSLRIVHSLEPLNKVMIAHSGLPPATEELADEFAGRACGGMFNLYIGYDERILDS